MSDSETTNQEELQGKENQKKKRSGNGSRRRKIEFVLTGKGGIGKSWIAARLGEFYHWIGEPAVCIDADPLNKTLSTVTSLDVVEAELFCDDPDNPGNVILNVREMDTFSNRMIREDRDFVIDCGASGYTHMNAYLMENAGILSKNKRVIVHSVLAAKGNLRFTMQTLAEQLEQLPDCVERVVWLNEYFGKVAYGGVSFLESQFYSDNKSKIATVISLPMVGALWSGEYLDKMTDMGLTFADVAETEAEEWHPIAKDRLAKVWKPIQEQLAAVT